LREVVFLRKNAGKWKHYEEILKKNSSFDPDKLAELYIELTNDLAYAQSQYPGTKTELYLNELSVKIHDSIHKTKKENYSRIITFWSRELPALYASKQKELLYAFTLFVVAVIIGWLSQSFDPDFARVIVGDEYVNMTMTNIEKGDPLAVYKDAKQMNMFFGITYNNVRVSFNAFLFGLLTVFGTGYFMLANGVMFGCFMSLFSNEGLLYEAIRVVMIHGTIELSAIIIAGAAGFVLGNSFIFPGTLSRTKSFVKAAKEGLKMIIGLVPLFIAAGFLESFVTRLTEMPHWLSWTIILLSAGYILFYFVLFPQYLNKTNKTKLYANS
jgi:uncharacterized membrane protein SpoIIM required for sporulation